MRTYNRSICGRLLATILTVACGWAGGAFAQGTPPPPSVQNRALLILDEKVIANPGRTTNPCKATPALKPWSFGTLMQGIGGRDEAGTVAFLKEWLEQFRKDQTINDETVKARDIGKIWNGWQGKGFDLRRAPFQLMAIVNRLDLFRSPLLPGENAGEVRFVFRAVDLDSGQCDKPAGRLDFTVILEYGARQASCAGLQDWAQRWTDLGAAKPADYLAALVALTDSVTLPNPLRAKPNGSAIDHVRTNEKLGHASNWQLREFRLDPNPTQDNVLVRETVTMTPRNDLKHKPDLEAFLDNIQGDILANDWWIPRRFPQSPNSPLAGGMAMGGNDWYPESEMKAKGWLASFAMNTCGGCHSTTKDSSGNVHGAPHIDPQNGQPSRFLLREVAGPRTTVLEDVVKLGCAAQVTIKNLVH
jgi:hypothetical protein